MPTPAAKGGGAPREDAGGYRARLPDKPFEGVIEDEWRRYVGGLVPHDTRAANIAACGKGLVERYLREGSPTAAVDIDRHAGRRVATNLLGRSTWDPHDTVLDLAADVMTSEPHVLLATPVNAQRSRKVDSFCVYGLSGLFENRTAVPVGFARSYGPDSDERHSVAVFELVNSCTLVASNCGCRAALASCDLSLGDHLIRRLAGDEYPFAAQVGPEWTNGEIKAMDAFVVGNAPFELFEWAEDRDHIHPRSVDDIQVELVRMLHNGNDTGLFLTKVGGEPVYFFVRPPDVRRKGVQQQLTAAAELAVRAASLRDDRPLAPLGLEAFKAPEDQQIRWDRHVAVLHAVLTFWHRYQIQLRLRGI